MSADLKKTLKKPSEISYNYATLKITQSRIDKGLLAIPVELAESFPRQNGDIQVYLNNADVSTPKRYSSYNSSTRECRIGGLKEWFISNNIARDDEIVVQFLDNEHSIYRLIPEKKFIVATKDLQHDFDNSTSETEAFRKVQKLSSWTLSNENDVVINEFQRLTNIPTSEKREYVIRNPVRSRETVPANLRSLLSTIYQGHCQICDFWFLRHNGLPYFETHHIEPELGHHPKNILVVCGNCHNQFEYARVRKARDSNNWLVQVFFNGKMYLMKQLLSSKKKVEFIKETYI